MQSYWRIGRVILEHLEAFPEAAARGEKFLSQVTTDLNKTTQYDISHDTLKRAVRFARVYPKAPKPSKLTFTHYLTLIRVEDDVVRSEFERAACKESWSVLKLKTRVAEWKSSVQTDDKRKVSKVQKRVLNVVRGEPYLYSIARVRDVHGQARFMLDCGFHTFQDLPDGNEHVASASLIVRSYCSQEKSRTGSIRRYELRSCQKARDKRFTYPARVERVIDGDTFDAQVDIGFGRWLKARFRLQGIDAPEIDTSLGKQAKAFVEECLATCPVIIVRSIRSGVYGRWLADVFVLPKESDPYLIAAEGEHLNQVLLDQGLAERF